MVVRHYFVAVSALDIDNLSECGCRNILMSYWYIKRILRKVSFSKIREKFDSIFVDSGAFTAFYSGKSVDINEYSQFLKDNREYIDVAAQLDVILDPEATKANYLKHLENGTDFVVPVVTGNWELGMIDIEKHLQTDYILLGGGDYWAGKWGWEANLHRLPKKYRYHGFAMGDVWLYTKDLVYSIDNSTWSMLARAGVTNVWNGARWEDAELGSRDRPDMNIFQRFANVYKDDMDACGLTIQGLMDYDRKTILKFPIAGMYRAWFRDISKEQFDVNFRF